MLDSATTMQHVKYAMEQVLTAIPARLLSWVTIVAILTMQLKQSEEAFTMLLLWVTQLKYNSALQ